MATIGWGKPKIEICKLNASGDYPTMPDWEEVPTPVEDSTQLNVTEGEKMEAKIEGGENEDVKYKSNTYQFTFNIRMAIGRVCPIDHFDGKVNDKYAVRLTPENELVPGFIADRCTVSIMDSWASAEGGIWQFNFEVLKPKLGEQVKWKVIEE